VPVSDTLSEVDLHSLPFLLVEEDDLCLLTSLLEENEAVLPCSSEKDKSLSLGDGDPDEFDELFDADGDGESYTEEAGSGEEGKTGNQEERLATLFGDVEDLTDDEVATSKVGNSGPPPAPSQEKTSEELQGNQDVTAACFLPFTHETVGAPSLTVFIKITAYTRVMTSRFIFQKGGKMA
jgi:hypothetical protein